MKEIFFNHDNISPISSCVSKINRYIQYIHLFIELFPCIVNNNDPIIFI